jgi:hypothetical protein
MKTPVRVLLLALCAGALAGCAVGEKLGWHRGPAEPATEVVQASCDSATATLKGQHDHDIAHRACVDAKTRQHVD